MFVDEVEADAASPVGEAELILREVDPLGAGRVSRRRGAGDVTRVRRDLRRAGPRGVAGLHRLSRDAFRDDAVEPRHELPLRSRLEYPVVREVSRVAVVVLLGRVSAGRCWRPHRSECLPSRGVAADEVVPVRSVGAGLDLAE